MVINNNKKPTVSRGHGKVEFNENLGFIKSELAKGKSSLSVHKELEEQNKITIDISVFRRYVRQLKEKASTTADQLHQNDALPPSSPPLLKLTSSVPSRPSSSVVVVGSKKQVAFDPQPADMAAEFADEGDAS